MSELISIEGSIIVIKDAEVFASGFSKRTCVIKTEGEYPDVLAVDFKKDKGDLLDQYSVGDSVKISCYLGGREWDSPAKGMMYFLELTGWTIEGEVGQTAPASAPVSGAAPADADDSMPF